MKIVFLLATLLYMIAGSSIGYSHDLRSKIALDSLEEKIRQSDLSDEKKGTLFSLVRRANLWSKNDVTVCFGPRSSYNSRKPLIEHIINIAQEWTVGTRVKFDFGPSSQRRFCKDFHSADIRVDISDHGDEGLFTSLLGNRSAKTNALFSMELQFPAADENYSDERIFRFYVLHEFGHALGFEHEHQRIDCSYNYQFIAENFNFKDENQARQNMSKIFSVPTHAYVGVAAVVDKNYISTAFDDNSVMKYNLATRPGPLGDDPGVYLDGDKDVCYRSGWISALTDYDKAGVGKAYQSPIANGAAFSTLLNESSDSELSAPAIAVIKSIVPKSGGLMSASETDIKATTEIRAEIKIIQSDPKAFQLFDELIKEAQH